MFVIIDVYSKNKTSLKLFNNCFLTEELTEKFKFNVIKTVFTKPVKKKVFTVLKSPHVNKVAQEHFEYKVYKSRVSCFVPQFPLFLIFLKKLKFSFFSDINCKIKLVVNTKIYKKKVKKLLNINDYEFDFNEFNLTDYFKILTISGECFLKF